MSIGEQTGQTRSKLLTRWRKSNGKGEWELEREMVAKLGEQTRQRRSKLPTRQVEGGL